MPTQVSTVVMLFRQGDPSFTRVNSSQDQFSDGREVLPPVYSKFLLLQSVPIVFMLWKEMTSFCLPGVRAASTREQKLSSILKYFPDSLLQS